MQKGFEKGAQGPPTKQFAARAERPLGVRENTHFLSKCEVFLWENHIFRKTTVLQPLKEVT